MFENDLQQIKTGRRDQRRTAVGPLYGSAASRLLIELAAGSGV